jgi:hypothetical protein
MIKLNCSITNPWSSKWDAGRAWGRKLTTTKAWECQLYRSNVIIEAVFEFTTRQDHAGLRLEFGIASWCFTFNIYDTRHWNYAENCYQVYKDE